MGRRSQSRPPSSGSKGSKFRISRADCKSPVDERFLGHHSWVLPSPLPLRIFRHPFFARIRDGDAMRSLNQPASRNRSTRQQKKVGKKWTAKNEVPRSFEKTPKPETSFQKSKISQTSIFKLSEPIFRFHLSFCNCLPKPRNPNGARLHARPTSYWLLILRRGLRLRKECSNAVRPLNSIAGH